MSLPIYDLTPWDKVVQWGNAYHGHWRKNADGSIDPISGLTGEIIPVDPATMSKSVNTGPCWLTRFPGLQMPVTTQEEAAAGMYWTNYAVWSGTDLVYNSIINHPSITLENKKLLNKSSFEFVYRCEDKTVWWIYYEKSTKNLMARIPRTQTREVIFDMTGYDLVTWRNFSESGKKVAFGFGSGSTWADSTMPDAILELEISGGSESLIPNVSLTRYRQTSSGVDPLTSRKWISQADVQINDDAAQNIVQSFGLMNMDVGWTASIKVWPEIQDPNDWYFVNGTSSYRDFYILFVDYDGETSVDIGYFNQTEYVIDEKIIEIGTGVFALSGSTITTHGSGIFRGNNDEYYYKYQRNGPHPINLIIPSDQLERTIAEEQNKSQVTESCPINVGPPIPYEVTGPQKNSLPYIVKLYGKYVVLSEKQVAYTNWMGSRIYSYGTSSIIYGYSSNKSNGLISGDVSIKFNEFSLDPLTGSFTPGIIGYF